jgi:diacylglycerol kinase (ATP)
VLRHQGDEVLVVVGASAADAERRAAQVVARGARGLVVVGGDGVVHLGVNVAARAGVPLGIVAAGSGNDFARAVGVDDLEVEAAVGIIAEAQATGGVAVDLGRLENDRYFACVLSIGFDAAVNARANRLRGPIGRARYPIAMLTELRAFTPRDLVIDVDGVRHHHRGMLVAIGNAGSYGGDMRICPDASLTDGLFHVTVVEEMSVPELLRLFPTVYRGTHVDHPKTSVYVGTRVHVVPAMRQAGDPVFADGERVTSGQVTASVAPAALQVLVPALP